MDINLHFPNNAILITTTQVTIDKDHTFLSLLDWFIDSVRL